MLARPDSRHVRLASILPLTVAMSLLSAGSARGSCINPSDVQSAKLMALADRDPISALVESGRRLAHGPSAGNVAWLWGSRAQAFSLLDDADEARAAAARGLASARDPHDPAHAQLLMTLADNVSRPDEIERSFRSLTAVRELHRSGSVVAVCIQTQLGDVLLQQNKPDAAAATLDDAYRKSHMLTDLGPRITARSRLATLAGYQSDIDQALALLREQLRDHERLGQTFLIGLLHRRMALVLNRDDRFDEALAELRRADRILGRFDAPLVGASLDVEACRAYLGLEQWKPAEARCRRARRVFAAHHSPLLTQATSQLARIRLGLGDAAGALVLFNAVLERSGSKATPASATAQLQWRAKAYAMIGRYDEAYRDLQQYLTGYKKWNDAAAKKQAAEFRAQLEADRQAARSRELETQLLESRMRSRIERRSFVSAAIAAVLALILLSFGVVALNWHRRRLSKVARTDALTGLLNRRAAVERAEILLAQGERSGRPVTFALIDLDNFKAVNDAHGHAAGDDVLMTFAAVMRGVVSARGVSSRWGGEEFLLIFPDVDAEAAVVVLEDLHAAAASMSFVWDADLKVSFSAGLAEHAKSGEGLDALVARADAALYRAKNGGRSRTCVDGPGRTGGPIFGRRHRAARRTS